MDVPNSILGFVVSYNDLDMRKNSKESAWMKFIWEMKKKNIRSRYKWSYDGKGLGERKLETNNVKLVILGTNYICNSHNPFKLFLNTLRTDDAILHHCISTLQPC